MPRGRHISRGNPAFVRDLVIMAAGTLVVAALVFGALWVLTSLGDDDTAVAATTTTTAPTTSTAAPTTASTSTTAAAEPSTTTSTIATTTTTGAVREPSEIEVLVLNAKGVSGLAASVTEDLGELGYVTLDPDNHPALDRSRIWYREGYGAEALELAASFPDALIEFNPDVGVEWETDVVVVLGASYEE